MDLKAPAAQSAENEIASRGLRPKRLAFNAIASFLNYGLSIAVGLWYTPFMLSKLPEAAYSMVPLAASFTNHLAVIMGMVTASVSRYVTAELSRGDVKRANAVFNSFLFAGIRIGAVLQVAIALFCLVLPVKVPDGYEITARIVFFAILGSFVVTAFGSCFVTSMWATNRFDIHNLIEATALVIRNGSVAVLFLFTKPDLWQVAVAVPLAAAVQIGLQYGASRKLTPELRIDTTARTPDTERLVSKIGQMLLLAQIGQNLLVSSDLVLVNRFIGPDSGGKYAVVLVWASVLRAIFSSMSFLILPAMVAYEATDDYQRLLHLSTRVMRLSGTVIAHVTGVLCGLATPLLAFWLKKPWTPEVVPVAWLLLIPLNYEIATSALSTLLVGPKRVKWHSIGSLACGIASVLLSTALLKFTDLGIYGVALGAGIVSIFKSAFYSPVLAATGTPVHWTFFLRPHLVQLVRFAATSAIGYLAAESMRPSTFWELALAAAAVAVVTVPPSILLLPPDERRLLWDAVLSVKRKLGL